MSFPRYAKYKDSGVEWLGEVPEHWDVKRLGYLCAKIGSGKTPAGGAETYPDDGSLFLRSQNVHDEGLRLDEVAYITEDTDEELRASRVQPGDILLNITGASLGRTCMAPLDLPRANVNQHVCIIRLNSNLLREFVALAMQSSAARNQIDAGQTGAARDGLNFAQVSRLALAIAPAAERDLVVALLQRETAKIDALVKEQRQLVALLKEKRQAAISHAVTKGLNPCAAMRPSGVAWLGDVPAHWKPLSLRRCAVSVETGGTPKTESPNADVEDGQPWYTPGDFGDLLCLEASTRKVSRSAVESGEVKVFPARSVLVVSIGATLGKVGFAAERSSANQQINAVIPNDRVDGYFLAYSLSVKAEAMRFLSNASTIGIMNQDKTKEIWVAVPPHQEQSEITRFLDIETAKLDTLTAEAQRAIDLLHERRAALITAAVTGKIDVRHLAQDAAA